MTPAEIKRLKTVARFLKDEAAFIEKKSRKLFRQSGAYDNAGDEGWRQSYQMAGKCQGLREAAQTLENLIEGFKEAAKLEKAAKANKP